MMRQLADRNAARRKNKNRMQRERKLQVERLEERALLAVLPLGPMQGGSPNYFGPEPNWAYSPLPDIDPATGDVVPGTGIRKFVDSMAGLTAAGQNNLGQYIPVAIPDTTTYPGSDYYEIELGEYTEQMHSDLDPTTLRGYRQTNTTDPTVSKFHNLGPMIVAMEDRPVRVKFTNSLPIGEGGDLFLPVDTTVTGSGVGPNMATPVTAARVGGAGATVEITTIGPHIFNGGEKVMLQGFTPAAYNGEFRVGLVTDATHFQITLNEDPGGPATALGDIAEMYTDSRGLMHLHGGLTPWISDGTPHQWTAPAGEFTNYDRGASAMNVPDMPDPGEGSITYFWPNQQSSRLMFYHDHSFGITRLGVYAGGAAGYLLTDFVEQDLIAREIIPSAHIPLIIQDKSFIDPTTILDTDPTWPFALDDELSNLWFNHVYMPNQNPNSMDAVNPLGRWDYGPWIWPPFPVEHEPIESPDGSLGFGFDGLPDVWPNLPDVSVGMESFFDTPVVNGTVYPYLEVQPQPYRFSILNAANDRFFNLQLVQADPTGFQVTDANGDTWGTEVQMVPFCSNQPNGDPWPADWPTPDLRDGGIPDPTKLGPDIIQIGTEGGFLPAPVVFNNVPIGFDMDSLSATVGNVLEHNVFLGPAERADIIVDLSQFAGQTLILYNDAPAAVPGNDPRYDYYTDNPDMTHMGGNVSTIPGYGPNTRTVMQIRVADTAPAPAFDLAALQNEFITTPTHDGVFIRNQDPIIVPQADYNDAYGVTDFPDFGMAYERIQSRSLTFKPLDLSTPALGDLVSTPVTIENEPKAIIEEWAPDWGRMQAYLGVERVYQNNLQQTSLWFGYKDPVTEIIDDTPNPLMTPIGSLEDGTELWKITHNGVDTHPIHFHLFNVQVVNRVDWVGVVKPPEPNELGWKETVRMNPLEDIIIALRPTTPKQPFGVPDSVRLLDPSQPEGSTLGFVPFDANGNVAAVVNEYHNYGWEYVWHCHILSHEENDMMRPIQVNVARELPAAPGLSRAVDGTQVDLLWTDGTPVTDPTTMGNPANEVGYRIERAQIEANGQPGVYLEIGKTPANKADFTDTTADPLLGYSYRVVVFNAAGESTSNTVEVDFVAPTLTIDQAAGQADPASTEPILFTVVFSEQVTGFDATDVTLSGTALATTAVVSTSDNITFAVEASGMSQDGTVVASVAAGAANDLLGNPSEASTSTDNSVLFYTGPLPQPLPYNQDFSSGVRGAAGLPGAAEGWEYFSTGKGRIIVTRNGKMRMDKRPTANVEYALNEATLHVNLTGHSNVELTLVHRVNLDVADVYAGTEFTGHVNADLIAVSVDGTNWVKVTDLDAKFVGQTFALDALVQQAAQAAGSTDLSNVRIKFQQYGSEPWGANGRKLDNILVSSSQQAPLMAAKSRTPAKSKGVLNEAALEPIVTAALADWSSMGLAPEVMNRLQSVQFVIIDLPGATLALAAQDTIYLDLDAAGNGWFVDSTPTKNEEFRVRNRDGQLRAVDRRIRRRIDLKTAVLHELGHIADLADMDALVGDLMNSSLPTGIRRSVWDASVDKVFESGSLWVRRNGR